MVLKRKLKNIIRKILKARRTLKGVNWFKTIYLNFKTQRFSTAVKLPILVYGKLKIVNLSGSIVLEGPIKLGRFRIGYNSDLFSASKGGALLNLNGTILSHGYFWASVDVLLQVVGLLELEDGTFFGNGAKLRCINYIYFGVGSRMASECQAFDTNFHYMRNIRTGETYRRDGKIIVGNYCWIGNRTTLSKGTIIPDYAIVASNSLCNKDYSKEDIQAPFIGGIPAKILGQGVVRIFDIGEEAKIETYFANNPDKMTYKGKTGLEEERDKVRYAFENL